MRLPLPGPGDLLRVADRGYDAIERAIALVPRIGRLIDQIEQIATRADAVVTDVDRTRRRADQVIDHTDELVARAGALVASAEQLLSKTNNLLGRADGVLSTTDGLLSHADGPVQKASGLLDQFQPALTELAPILDQLAATTSPEEVAAVIKLIDTLPELVERLETEILPILGTFGTVAPDIRDLLETTREFNEILGSVPGLGRIKKRVEERQEQQDSERA
ncbi:MAG: hypothetical protein ABI140_07680 [Jatrophihabitantaceae bacterium]